MESGSLQLLEDYLSEKDLKNFQNKSLPNQMLIIKFTATWCMPCKRIKSITEECVKKIPNSIIFIEIDIDDSIELYMKLKNKKMVAGIPAILAYKGGQHDYWYVPDDSCLVGNVEEVKKFFERCIKVTM
tara:strand:- start:692 stop:1078 length:387 start_codon:yes stop_codon:yes gene_type:complete